MIAEVDYYALLEVDPRADLGAIRRAYRSLARRYHPDVAGGVESTMAALNAAWAVLRDPDARAAYDRARSAPVAADRARSAPVATSSSARPTPSSSRPATAPPRQAERRADVLDFGQYAGWSLRDIARRDPDYLRWLERTQIGRRYQAQIDALLATQQAPPAPAGADRRRRRGLFGRG